MSVITVKLIFLFSFILIIGAIFFVCHKAETLMEQEKGKKPLYTAQCTAYMNGLRYVYARFTIYNDFIVIGRWKKYLIKYEDIISVQKKYFLFSKNLKIKHSLKKIPTISLYMRDTDVPLKIIQQQLYGKV